MSFQLSRAKIHFLFSQAQYCDFDILFFNILTTKVTSSLELASLPTLITSLISLEPSSFQTFSAMCVAMDSSTSSFVSLVTAISVNSSKVYSGTSNIANLDRRGSIIFSEELAVAKTHDVSSICLV